MNPLRNPRLVGGASAALGLILVMTLVLTMNTQLARPDDDAGRAASSIDVVKKEKPPQPEPVKRPEPPRRKPQRNAPAPLVGLDSGLAGLSFGLPGFDASELDLGKGLLGDSGDVVMTDDSVDVPPRPIVQAPMAYPSRAKASGVTGYVVLSVLIGPTGQVEKVKVLESQPSGVFDDVAAAGVQGWKFEPAQYKGENVRVWAKQRVRFDLS
ncbi:energy transducer TonB [Pseudomarimonas salicorniae]|uniref:Protein TonB n=1 Tax=Pseudomarimonas salicorniae TaxID=2933270 RepID=A0ABT0GET3_9GAMM|nr:energy transducer TonB [Lysobacter sp. CAU 1642]MCK7592530.1 TonB family protein [Lysobacter sp. CAU 1642]